MQIIIYGSEPGLQGLIFMIFSKNKFTRYSAKQLGINSDVIWSIFKDSKNNMWIGTETGDLLRYDFIHKEFENLSKKTTNYTNNSSAITSICEDKKGLIWFSTYGNGIYNYSYSKKAFTNFKNIPSNENSISDNIVWKVFCDSKGLLWIGTVSRGLTIYDSQKNIFTRVNNNAYDNQSLSSDLILGIYEDKANNLWVGTSGGGVNKIDRKKQNFYQLKNEFNNPNSLAGNFVFSICEDKNENLWIANYEKGISRYNPAANKFIIYRNESGSESSLSTNKVRCIYEDKEGDIWIGTHSGGLNKFDEKTNSFKRYTADGLTNGLNSKNVRAIFEDSENELWLATSGGGLNKFNKVKNKFEHFTYNPDDDNSLSNDDVTSVCEDTAKYLWLTTDGGGLNRFDKKNNFKRYFYTKDDTNSISENFLVCSFSDSKGNLWIGSWGGGLNLYNRTHDNFIHFREKDGLLSDVICGIVEDKKGNLWISTVKGISKFNFEKKEFTNYDINDGIKGELNPSAFFFSKTGWIFFGGIEGVFAFHPDSLTKNENIPSIAITSVKKFNEEFPTNRQAPYLENLKLKYNEDVISFEFASLDFTHPSKNYFAYKLEGFDNDWIYSGSRHYASYTHLDPGEYIFKVKGTNNSGVWSALEQSVNLIITPPYWQTWWFRSIMILFIAGILYSFYKIKLNRILELERLRIKIASDLHDDIGSALTRISIDSDLLKSNLSNEETNPIIQRIGNVSREIISSMSDVVWSIDSRNDTIQDLINRMKDFAYSVLSPKNILVTFEIDNINLQKKMKIDLRQNIYLIFKEAINNSSKYSNAEEIKVSLKNSENNFIMIINDLGNHIAASGKLTGHGLRNMKMRAERIGGKIEFVKENGFKIILITNEL